MRFIANSDSDSNYINPVQHLQHTTEFQQANSDVSWQGGCVSSLSLDPSMNVVNASPTLFDNNPNYRYFSSPEHEDISAVLAAKNEHEGSCICQECIDFFQDHPCLPENMLETNLP